MTEYVTRPTTERAGILSISNGLMKQLVPTIDIEQCDTQRFLRQSGMFEALHEALKLPKSCTIHFIWAEIMGRLWAVMIESPEFPIAATEPEWPRIEARYEQKDGVVSLIDLSTVNDVLWSRERLAESEVPRG